MSDHLTTNGPGSLHPSNFGTFFGRLLLEPLPDGRLMRVVEPFGFRNHDATEWPVPVEARTDGASIPRALWTLIGGPFEGKYRKIAVVHDYYCSTRTASWRDVHRVFYNGMRASGVSGKQAKLLYTAVYFAGPRWSEMDIHNARLEPPARRPQGRFAEELVRTKALHFYDDLTNHARYDLRIGDVSGIIARLDPSPDEIADALDHLLDLMLNHVILPPSREFEYLDGTVAERWQGSVGFSLSCVENAFR
jgi:hypothetical protein